MKHPRQIIREAIRDRLVDRTVAGDRVFSNRPTRLDEQDLPAILIYTATEQAEIFNESPRRYLRTVEVRVEIAESMNDELDDTLDSISQQVERLILQDDTLGGATSGIILTGSAMTIVGGGERPIGAVILTFDAAYFYTMPDEVYNEGLDNLATVHSEFDLGGMQAEADRNQQTVTGLDQ